MWVRTYSSLDWLQVNYIAGFHLVYSQREKLSFRGSAYEAVDTSGGNLSASSSTFCVGGVVTRLGNSGHIDTLGVAKEKTQIILVFDHQAEPKRV